ncbi:MAG: hypothetical protein IME94_04400 [Proteobacteria bacterium]|nr:hypothetical protein [Pseudomonadota bacterium]
MSNKSLLEQLNNFFDMKKKKRKKNISKLKTLIKELKQEKMNLIVKCSQNLGKNERKMVKRKIAIIDAKRKKGLKAVKKLIQN